MGQAQVFATSYLGHDHLDRLLTFYSFQKVQGLSALQSSIRFLPNLIIGIIISIGTGLIAHRFSAYYIVVGGCLVSAGTPVLLATIDPEWSYWYSLFWAMALSPFSSYGKLNFP